MSPRISLDIRSAGKAVPAVTHSRAAFERLNLVRYLGIHIGRILSYRQHLEQTAVKCRKGASLSWRL